MDLSNDDDDYIEEDILVYADFQSKITPSSLRDPNVNVKIIGLDTAGPIMEIGDRIFQGKPSEILLMNLNTHTITHPGSFEHAIGTHVFFEQNHIPPPSLDNYETIPDKWYKYANQTDRILRMNRIFVKAKEPGQSVTPTSQQEQSADAVMSTERTAGIEDADTIESASRRPTDADAAAEDPPIRIEKSYATALNQFLKPGEKPPRPPNPEDEEFFRNFGSSSSSTALE